MTQANLEALSREVERQNAIVDCKNLMGKVMYYGVAWLNRKMVELCRVSGRAQLTALLKKYLPQGLSAEGALDPDKEDGAGRGAE